MVFWSRFFKTTFKPVCFVNHRFSTFQSAPELAKEICDGIVLAVGGDGEMERMDGMVDGRCMNGWIGCCIIQHAWKGSGRCRSRM